MIAGPAGVFICDSCVRVCKTIIDRELGEKEQSAKESGEKPVFNLLKPAAIKAHLDEHVIGQDHAKKFFLLLSTTITKDLQAKWVLALVLPPLIRSHQRILRELRSKRAMS